MGAFGELLIQTWGDLSMYRDDNTINQSIPKESDQRYIYQLSIARRRLGLITSNLMYRPQDIKLYTEDSIKKGFNHLGFDAHTQDVMWDEYCSFLDSYINKSTSTN